MAPPRRRRPLRWTRRRDLVIAAAAPTVLVVAAFIAAYVYVEPAPPRKLVMAVARGEGGEEYFAKRYQKYLSEGGNRIALEVRFTNGPAESLALLADPSSGVDTALTLGGLETSRGAAEAGPVAIVSLGSLTYSPIWVFHRGPAIDDPIGLRGRRLAVGPEGSGTRALALKLLHESGSDAPPTELLPYDRERALKALCAGEIDAMFVVSPPGAPFLKQAANPKREEGGRCEPPRLLAFARAEAYARRFPWLQRVVLPRGLLDLAADIPPADVPLVAPTVNLVARAGLHPALAYLLMRAAGEIHGRAGLLHHAGEFPAAREAGYPLSEEAQRYYRSGAPWLQRYLPFWVANLVDRLWVMAIPVVAVVLPLLRLVPSLYAWRMRRRIHGWYARLKELELELEGTTARAVLEGMLERLDELEQMVHRTPVPVAWSDSLYTFRGHVEFLRASLVRRLRDAAG